MLPPYLASVSRSAGLKGPALTDYSFKTVRPPVGLTTIKSAAFAWQGGHRLMEVGAGAEVYVEDSTLDGTNMTNLMAAAVQLMPASPSRVTFRRSRFDNATVSFLKSFGASLHLDECFVGAFGLGAAPDAHLEQVFVNQGALTVSGSVLDGSGGAGRMIGGVTGLLYLEASSGPIFAHLTRSALIGCKAIKAPAAIQISARPYPVVVAIGDCIVEKGTSQHIAVTEGAGLVQIIDLGGNVDAETGAPVDLSYPKRGQVPKANPLVGELQARLQAVRNALA